MKLLLERVRNTRDCVVLPPSGLPQLSRQHSLPEDLKEFYTDCGGVKFFSGSNYSMEIVSPDRFVLSNPEVLPEGWERDVPDNDISNDWYIVAEAGVEQRLSIDLGEKRVGRCYDSFWDIHASPGESRVVARSFSDLINSIFSCGGNYWFWLADDFLPLGDAYD
ncbi:MAG: SMI1/KNR4 family protein [Pseudomonadota bacterium]